MTASLQRFRRRLERNLQEVHADLLRTRHDREEAESQRSLLLADLDRTARARFQDGGAPGQVFSRDPLGEAMEKAENRLAERLVVLRRAEENLEQRLRGARVRVRAVERLLERREEERQAAARTAEVKALDEVAVQRHAAELLEEGSVER